MRTLACLVLVVVALLLWPRGISAQGVLVWPQPVPVAPAVPAWGALAAPPNPLTGWQLQAPPAETVLGVGYDMLEVAQATYLASKAHAIERHGQETYDLIEKCPVEQRWLCPRAEAPTGQRIYEVHDCSAFGRRSPGLTIYEVTGRLVTRFFCRRDQVDNYPKFCTPLPLR